MPDSIQPPFVARGVEPRSTRAQLRHFLVVGVLTVLVDFATYRLLLAFGVDVAWAKGTGFVTGTVFAYFANRHWTFAGAAARRGSVLRFAVLYGSTLAVNVASNALLLAMLLRVTGPDIAVPVAFVGATGLSATLNFIGMKFFVFRPQARP